MRTVRRNKQPMKYSLYIGNVAVVETDFNGDPISYTDGEGNIIYMVTGEKLTTYSTPEEFDANLSMSGGEAEAQAYGLSTADYEAVALYSKGAYPLVEGALIWTTSEVEYENLGEEVYVTTDMHDLIKVKTPKETSSDYRVVRILDSLNYTKAILKATSK